MAGACAVVAGDDGFCGCGVGVFPRIVVGRLCGDNPCDRARFLVVVSSGVCIGEDGVADFDVRHHCGARIADRLLGEGFGVVREVAVGCEAACVRRHGATCA